MRRRDRNTYPDVIKLPLNMPPGCNVRDIPGNRPEDEAAEALCDKIADILVPLGLGDPQLEPAVEAIFKLCGEVYREGYDRGVADEGQTNYWKTQA